MIRVGMLSFDTSHVVEFTRRLNRRDVDPAQWVDGAEVVVGYVGTSEITPPERIAEYRRVVADGYGVPLVERPEEMLGRVDAVMVEAQGGGPHLALARPFLEAGIPTFIDKPFACSVADAREMAALAARHGAPLLSSSSLRYATEIEAVRADQATMGRIVGAETYSPGTLHPGNPGLFHYGIHAVEPLYALLGPGCRSVCCVATEGAHLVVGEWSDGRIGVVRAIRQGFRGYGFTAYGETGIRAGAVDTSRIFAALLRRVVEMFRTGRAPLDVEESIEIVAFIVAALRSEESGGAPVRLAEVMR